jgi:hypothetical protein
MVITLIALRKIYIFRRQWSEKRSHYIICYEKCQYSLAKLKKCGILVIEVHQKYVACDTQAKGDRNAKPATGAQKKRDIGALLYGLYS